MLDVEHWAFFGSSTPGGLRSTLPIHDLLFRFRYVRREIFLATAQGGQETDTITLLDHARPTFVIDVAPAGKVENLACLRVPFRRKKEELHPLLGQPNLRHTQAFFVIENTSAQCVKIRELGRHVIMGQTMLHKKQIAERSGISFYRIQDYGASRARYFQQSLCRPRSRKILQMFDELINKNSGNNSERDGDRHHGRITRQSLPGSWW